MTRTDFSNAFLYGVDFAGSETTINGVDFSNAILVGASFDGASFDVDPTHGGAQPKFPGAFLQGTNFGAASLDNTSFANAYVDFEPGGNNMQVLLGPSYTGFNGWQPANQPVCVKLDYTSFVTTVPVTRRHHVQKKACTPASRTVPTSRGGASGGRNIKAGLTPGAWSSSTRPGPRPT